MRLPSPNPGSHPASSGGVAACGRRDPSTTALWLLAATLGAAGLAAWAPAPLLTLLVIAPVAEELVFRGGVQETLLRQLNGRHPAAALVATGLTAFVIVAVHAALRPEMLAGLTLLPSLLIGWVYQRRRRLAPCMALHALFNAAWLLRSGAGF